MAWLSLPGPRRPARPRGVRLREGFSLMLPGKPPHTGGRRDKVASANRLFLDGFCLWEHSGCHHGLGTDGREGHKAGAVLGEALDLFECHLLGQVEAPSRGFHALALLLFLASSSADEPGSFRGVRWGPGLPGRARVWAWGRSHILEPLPPTARPAPLPPRSPGLAFLPRHLFPARGDAVTLLLHFLIWLPPP